MKHAPKTISIMGATGTIGQNTLKLLKEANGQFRLHAVTAKQNAQQLADAALACGAKLAVIEDEAHYPTLKSALEGSSVEAAAGRSAITEAAREPCDILISSIVGYAALEPTMAAIKNGVTIGLANKECLVAAGSLMMAAAKKSNAAILPIDSEHNAVFQTLDPSQVDMLESITLTASGGPFRTLTQKQMEHVTLDQALTHPNWRMGAKISIDSATMMNKGLEVIEAYHLFPVEKNQINILVHPESIIHCLVNYKDGSVLAALSVPDMRVPIAHALAWPRRLETSTPRLNLAEIGRLTFEAPDIERFPAIALAYQCLAAGGNAPILLNAANEIAVSAFIAGEIRFLQILTVVKKTLEHIAFSDISSLEAVFEQDAHARRTAHHIVKEMRQ